jgi:hypothetical protein
VFTRKILTEIDDPIIIPAEHIDRRRGSAPALWRDPCIRRSL